MITYPPTNRPCKVPGCLEPLRSVHATLCEKHRQRDRLHGHPQQETITLAHLRPLARTVKAIVARDRTGRVGEALDQLHGLLRGYASGVIAEWTSGRACVRKERDAARELLTVLDATNARECAMLMAALFLLREQQPRLFVNDRAFRFQAARIFRRQTKLSAGAYWDDARQQTKLVYKDLPTKVTDFLGRCVVDAYARFAAHVITQWRQDQERKARADALLDEAFAGLAAAE